MAMTNGLRTYTMSAGNERFNTMAAAWDNNPNVHQASERALQAILKYRPDLAEAKTSGRASSQGLQVLEIGCGTGLLTLRLAPFVRSIVAVDAAKGMIDALTQKLARDDWSSVRDRVVPLCLVLEDPEDPALPAGSSSDGTPTRRKFDLVISHLVLHHIGDHKTLLKMLFGSLASGGQVALTDYENTGPASRRFHPESKMDGVEHPLGIHADTFAALMKEAGFVDVIVEPEWSMEKTVESVPGEWNTGKPKQTDGMKRQDFPFLLCRGTKPHRG
ncbi:methyltransferase type 11 [Ophiostoma piceae UAMH 11346]|uniref:Methyltransferase type 11 n=1 Tax=Ophiostoma piceae (strain UAMH 11346) TaxID=1262450 RepID=S3D7I8_OPHP1|nr:methyltransferase type 11 [Ophiostoma piceae UAMH 11346]